MKQLSLLLTVILYLFVGFYAYIKIKGNRSDQLEAASKTKFEGKIDSLKMLNAGLDLKYQQIHHKADSLEQAIVQSNKKLNQLKITRNEKIISIDHFNSTDLYNLFSEFKAAGPVAK